MADPLRPYVIRQGDHLHALADRHGFDPATVWNDPKNASVKSSRNDDPHMLLAGDVIYIPEVRPTWLPITVGSTNTFKVPLKLVAVSARFMADGKPLAGETYVVEGVDVPPGSLDGDGFFHAKVPARLRSLTLRLTARNEAYHLNIGDLDPPDSPSGLRMRLGMLGTYGRGHRSDADGTEDLKFGLKQFQRANKLPVTGEADEATVAKVVDLFGR